MGENAPDDNELRRLLLGRRLEALASGWLLALAPTLAAICALLAMHLGEAPADALMAAVALVFLGRLACIGWVRSVTPLSRDLKVLERQWRAANVVLMLGSIAGAVGLLLAAGTGPGTTSWPLAIVGGVLFGGVLLTHHAAPAAAVMHVLSLGFALASGAWLRIGWPSWPILAVIAVYATALILAIRSQERAFKAAVSADIERRERDETVRAVLDEHETQKADWVWTVRPDGTLCDVSDRLADTLQASRDVLEGQDFLSLLEPGDERDRIASLIAGRRPFRDESVHAHVANERRHWRLSGNPRADGRMSGTGRDITIEQLMEERIRAMALVDPLTGLANRHAFYQHLREALGGEEARKPPALLHLDLDNFRSVNDTRGQLFGDDLLREMGARLRLATREGDLIARLGGDEFAVVVHNPGGDGLLIEQAHRLLAVAREPFEVDGQSLRLSTSVGIARAGPSCDAAELMRRADLALYAAKAKGPDQLAIFDEASDRLMRERRSLEQELREAVGRSEMLLLYQPIIALQSGNTVGYEALLRWRHPRRGLLAPGEFLPLAEESGLIGTLGDWVIRRALNDIADWPGDFRLALNLSPSQTRSSHLIATIDAALAASGMSASRLEFEITEHVLLHDAAAGGAAVERLRALGAKIALDDFGTGYSSLSYLRRYRFDRVKIDRSFVRDIETSDESQAIVSAITRLAQALGMYTTAEGVERPGQLDLLRKLGCDEAQGFLILEPVEAAAIEEARAHGQDLPGIGLEIEEYRRARQAGAPATSIAKG
jgi:diguanylate cyclase (GGDEF)-like protein